MLRNPLLPLGGLASGIRERPPVAHFAKRSRRGEGTDGTVFRGSCRRAYEVGTLTSKQAAKYLRTSEAALRLCRSEGTGPRFFRAGERLIRSRRADLDLWIEARLSEPPLSRRGNCNAHAPEPSGPRSKARNGPKPPTPSHDRYAWGSKASWLDSPSATLRKEIRP